MGCVTFSWSMSFNWGNVVSVLAKQSSGNWKRYFLYSFQTLVSIWDLSQGLNHYGFLINMCLLNSYDILEVSKFILAWKPSLFNPWKNLKRNVSIPIPLNLINQHWNELKIYGKFYLQNYGYDKCSRCLREE